MDLQWLIQDQALEMFKWKISEKFWTEIAKDNKLVSTVINKVLWQLWKNADNTEEAWKIMSALDKHTNSGINLDINDGKKILGHIFGNNESQVEKEISEKSWVDNKTSKDLLSLASSFVMQNLWSAKAEGKLNTENMSGMFSLASKFLDADGDGSITDDIFDIWKKMLFGSKK